MANSSNRHQRNRSKSGRREVGKMGVHRRTVGAGGMVLRELDCRAVGHLRLLLSLRGHVGDRVLSALAKFVAEYGHDAYGKPWNVPRITKGPRRCVE